MGAVWLSVGIKTTWWGYGNETFLVGLEHHGFGWYQFSYVSYVIM